MDVRISFSTDNAAFEDNDGADEIARLVHGIADKLYEGERSGVLRDYNGNRVGSWSATR